MKVQFWFELSCYICTYVYGIKINILKYKQILLNILAGLSLILKVVSILWNVISSLPEKQLLPYRFEDVANIYICNV